MNYSGGVSHPTPGRGVEARSTPSQRHPQRASKTHVGLWRREQAADNRQTRSKYRAVRQRSRRCRRAPFHVADSPAERQRITAPAPGCSWQPCSGTQIAVLVPLPLCQPSQRVRSVWSCHPPSVFSQQRQLNGNQTRSAVVQMCIKERVRRAVIKSASRALCALVKPSSPRSVLACERRDATTVVLLKSILARFYNDENERPRCACDNSCFDRVYFCLRRRV